MSCSVECSRATATGSYRNRFNYTLIMFVAHVARAFLSLSLTVFSLKKQKTKTTEMGRMLLSGSGRGWGGGRGHICYKCNLFDKILAK